MKMMTAKRNERERKKKFLHLIFAEINSIKNKFEGQR